MKKSSKKRPAIDELGDEQLRPPSGFIEGFLFLMLIVGVVVLIYTMLMKL